MPLLQLVLNIKISKTTFDRLIIVETISFNFLRFQCIFLYHVEVIERIKLKWHSKNDTSHSCCACTFSYQRKIDLPKAIRDVHMHAILEQVYLKREMQLHFCRHSVKRGKICLRNAEVVLLNEKWVVFLNSLGFFLRLKFNR